MKKFLLLLCLFAAAAACARAQQPGPIANVGGRDATSLDGRWKVIVDPYNTGTGARFFRDARPKDKSELIEYGFDQSDALDVPGDWNTQRESLFFYEGSVWYRRTFDHALKPGTRLFLHFGAANYAADVYLNGEKVGGHEGGFTPFDFEVTGRVRERDNSLVVRVDNTRRRDAVPTLVTDWWNYGGLTRSVSLIAVPETFVRDYLIQLQKGSKNHIAGWVKLDGRRPAQKITVHIPEAGVSKSFTTDANGYAEVSFDASLKLWSPEDPKLYDVTVSSETDSVREQVGFRSIEVKGGDILLNGRPIFLRGVCVHAEAPLRTGRAFSREDARTLLGWAKELGANFVRLAHYPHDESMVREADRAGILVWSEVPVYWGIDFENPTTLASAENQLGEMIARDRNRASVILWSVANETPSTEARLRFLRTLVERARQLDPTRLLTAAMLHHAEGETTRVIDDPLGQYLDVIGCNEYIGWYDGLPPKADRTDWKIAYEKPLVMSEFGAEAVAGLHGDEQTRWTEEFQESFYRHQVGMLKRIPFLRGTSPWILMDFRSPRRLLPGVQDYYNRKGLVSERGQRKKAFYVMQEFYRELQSREGKTAER
jgi:beta-glucuronidase